MKFTSRMKFIFGILFVVLLVGALTLYLNGIMSVAHSSKAELAADSTSIGTDYPGLVVAQNVEIGDKVTKGEVLFEIQSPRLTEVLDNGTVLAAALPFSLNPANRNIQLKASDDGVVEKIAYQSGSYVPAGGIVATIDTVHSLYAIANFQLSPPDYARINKDSKLELKFPDNSTQQATVFSISLVRNGINVDTVVKARLKSADISDYRFSVGTPVQATLQLSQDTWYQSLSKYLEQLFKPVGR